MVTFMVNFESVVMTIASVRLIKVQEYPFIFFPRSCLLQSLCGVSFMSSSLTKS